MTQAFPVAFAPEINVEALNFVQLKSTTTQTCLLTAEGALFLVDHKNEFAPAELRVKESMLKNGIVQLEASWGHFLALKRKIRPSIKDWDLKRLQTWLAKIGFDYCQKIVQYSRITGARLASADYEFMRDTMGINDEN